MKWCILLLIAVLVLGVLTFESTPPRRPWLFWEGDRLHPDCRPALLKYCNDLDAYGQSSAELRRLLAENADRNQILAAFPTDASYEPPER